MATNAPSPVPARELALLALDGAADAAAVDHLALARHLPAVWRPALWLAAPDATAIRAREQGVPVVPVPSPTADFAHPPRALAAGVRLARQMRSRQVGLIHAEGLPLAAAGVVAGRLLGCPTVVGVREVHPRRALRHHGLSLAAGVLFGSAALRAACDWPAGWIVPPGVEPPPPLAPSLRDSLRQRLGAGPGDLLVGQVGPLNPLQAGDLAVEAAARLAESGFQTKVAFIGDDTEWKGRYHEVLASMAAQMGVGDAVSFCGAPPDATPLIQALDVLLCPTRGEPAVRTLLTAMAAGVVVVAVGVGEVPELVRHDEHGLLVPPEDVDAIVSALARLARQPQVRRRLASGGAQRARESYSLQVRAGHMVELYEEVSAPFLSWSSLREPTRWTSSH